MHPIHVQSLLFATALAAPTVLPIGSCPIAPPTRYTAIKHDPFWKSPKQEKAQCQSTALTTCDLGKSITITNGYIITEGFSLTLNM